MLGQLCILCKLITSLLLIVIFCHDSDVMQNAGSVQALLARELAEYEMQVEQNVLAPMTSLLEVIKIMNI